MIEPQVLGAAKVGYEEVLNPELLFPRLGVDESGKGDFFGPLCIAGVYEFRHPVRVEGPGDSGLSRTFPAMRRWGAWRT